MSLNSRAEFKCFDVTKGRRRSNEFKVNYLNNNYNGFLIVREE